ncbi:MAG: hypothetical protein LBH25_00520 [Fibromonadaceae bacterium]|jgi:uncharacterized protein (TIGR02145 family)|nr:hypothetical protein [Fibromonadaceae bacterium]
MRTTLAAIALLLPLAAFAQVDWSATNITVTTEAQLKELLHWVDYGNDFSGKTITLGADIELTSEWKPIGNEKNQFKGTFDGGGKSISSLSISGLQHSGFFGYVGDSGQVKNLVVDVTGIKTDEKSSDVYAGGLAAIYASAKPIENCGVNIKDSIASASYSDLSGLAGYIGGLVGYGKEAITIINSYTTGKVSVFSPSSNASHVGGLIGRGNKKVTISNSYTTGKIFSSGNSYLGGLIGYGNNAISISNSYATGDISGFNVINSGSRKQPVFSASGSSGKVGGLVGSVNTDYRVNGVITILDSYTTGNVSGSITGGLIGSGNAAILNSYATGNVSGSYAGGLIGSGATITITKSYATGNVSASEPRSSSYSGGLIGHKDGGYSDGKAIVAIRNSYATGNISATSAGEATAGGLMGGGDGEYGRITIANSYATGNVSATSDNYSYSGGLIGYVYEVITISNSYATGSVSTSETRSSSYSGGLVGMGGRSGSKIENSYVLGSVKGKVVGGIIGENKGVIENCYALAGSADMLIGKNNGGSINMASGIRTEEQIKQQSTYKDWDFANDWEIEQSKNNGFPSLRPPAPIVSSFKDSRDGKTYKTAKIGTQTWMAENLNYADKNDKNSKCYDNKPDNCNTYGRLYGGWGISSEVCPIGWHLPKNEEWETLINFVGGESLAGYQLKAVSGWDNNGNGKDDYGFTALPSGMKSGSMNQDGKFSYAGGGGYWLADYKGGYNSGNDLYTLSHGSKGVIKRDSHHEFMFHLYSVRCVQNTGPNPIKGNVGNYSFGKKEDGVSTNHQQAVWNLNGANISKAKAANAKFVLELSQAPTNGMQFVLVWQSPDKNSWWNPADLFKGSVAVNGVSWNASKKTLTIDLPKVIANYSDFKSANSLNLIIAYWDAANINDLGIVSANLAP